MKRVELIAVLDGLHEMIMDLADEVGSLIEELKNEAE